jgi:hypothetical protein
MSTAALQKRHDEAPAGSWAPPMRWRLINKADVAIQHLIDLLAA